MSGVLRFSIINIYFFYNWFYALLSVDGMLNENKIHWRYDETEKMKFSDQENENAFPMSFFFSPLPHSLFPSRIMSIGDTTAGIRSRPAPGPSLGSTYLGLT